MKTFEVVLTKSYKVIIKAEDELKARDFTEFFTSDIKDISSNEEKNKNSFKIENIDCKLNETFEVIEINEKN